MGKENKDEELWSLTPWGCMSCVLKDYGFDTTGITPKMGEHMVEDFMELLVKSGYVEKNEEDGK